MGLYMIVSHSSLSGQVNFQSMHKLFVAFSSSMSCIFWFSFQICHFYLCLRQPSLHCFYPYRKEPQIILKAWCLSYAIL